MNRTLLATGAMALVSLTVLLQREAPGQQIQQEAAVPAVLAAAKPQTRRARSTGDLAGGVVLPEDREMRRKLDLLKQGLEDDQLSEAVQAFGALLESPDAKDFFLENTSGERSRRGFKAELQRIIASLSVAGRQAYELQYGAKARRLLTEAVGRGDVSLLWQTSSRYLHTQAGGEALFLLGLNLMDHGRPREAAHCFAKLRLADARALEPTLTLRLAACWQAVGETDLAREELARLRQSFPNATFQFSGVDTALPAVSGAAAVDADLQWLIAHLGQSAKVGALGARNWLTHRGGATRNEACQGGLPLLSPRWDPLQISSDPSVLSAIQSEQEVYLNQQVAPLPMLEPLVVGNVILMRSAEGVQAVDFRSGKLLWPRGNQERGAFENHGVEGMLWRDAAFGVAATDGRYVFLIDDVSEVPNDAAGGQTRQMMFRGFRGGFFAGGQSGAAEQPGQNTLTALDINWNGALRWSVGGDDGKDCPALANHFFLGPPLAYEGQLYVLAECNGAIRIVSLDPISGQQVWSQELAVVENGIGADPFRRMSGATPSIDAGVIVCPTSAGGVVALELATRSLLWAYQYPRSRESRLDPRHGYYPKLRQGARWTDASATIAAGRVLLTPLESDEIHCLDLMTGDKLWTQKRGDHLYLACVQNKQVVLVGPKSLTALKLADGSPAWPQPLALPEGAAPSGRGVYAIGRYYLPLSSAHVAEIDLSAGKIVRQAASPRGIAPGNLIWSQGAFISQSPNYLEVFDERLALEESTRAALAKNPRDAAALVRLARIELASETKSDVKPLVKAIAHLRQAYAIAPTPRTRNLLITSLLEGVRRKLPNATELSDALDALIE